jgi:hypothetical protein
MTIAELAEQLGDLGSPTGVGSWRGEARTRGFATLALAECAFVHASKSTLGGGPKDVKKDQLPGPRYCGQSNAPCLARFLDLPSEARCNLPTPQAEH